MRKHACTRELEVVEALHASQWPHGCSQELREHVPGCASCQEIVDLVDALLADRRTLLQEANVPSSAIVWWRAQMRARREAVRRAGQPITIVQALVLACASGLMATGVGLVFPTVRHASGWMMEAVSAWSVAPDVSGLVTNPVILALAGGAALCAVIAPVVLYFTLRED